MTDANSQTVTVTKADHNGEEVISYEAKVLERGPTHIVVEARFTLDDRDMGYVTFRRGDRFVEWFYSDRWYNIFEIHAAETDIIKGWYCNFTRPAQITQGAVASDDLALDLFIYPDGSTTLLDEDEFAALDIPQADRAAVRAALAELRERAAHHDPPFNNR